MKNEHNPLLIWPLNTQIKINSLQYTVMMFEFHLAVSNVNIVDFYMFCFQVKKNEKAHR